MIEEANKEETTQQLSAEAPVEKPVETQETVMETLEKEVEAEQTAKTEETTAEKETATKSKKKKEEEIVEEKTYTIPLGKALIMPPRKRAPRAMRMIRAYIVKHMKIPSRAEEEDEDPPTLTITQEVNTHIWDKGIEKPPRKIRVRATKDKDGNVTVHLAENQ